MRILVSNTGPLLHLKEAGVLELLSLAGQVHIPDLVQRELQRVDPTWHNPDWVETVDLRELYLTEARAWRRAGILDPGESEAIALARQLGADWFLTDDAAARLIAQGLGLEVHGSLGVVLWAAATGHVGRARAAVILEQLAHSSLWLSPRVLREARQALEQLFTD